MDVWRKEDSSVTHATFSFEHGWHGTLLNRIVLHDSACIAFSYSVFLVQWLESNTQNGIEHSQVPKSRMTSSIEVRTSKRNWSLARSKTTFPWIPEHDRYMKPRVRLWRHGFWSSILDKCTWLGVNDRQVLFRTPCRVLARQLGKRW
jgi:hypothetical protein